MAPLSASAATLAPDGLRGTNQSGIRAYNERLVLSLLRRHEALAKSDLARISGLSAQTVSVIMRGLEAEGLILRGTPQRGRIGQPSVPMSLAPDGAFFFGLKIGRRSTDLVLIDFLGRVIAERRRIHRYPTPDGVTAFVAEALPELRSVLPPAVRDRIAGLGIALPFQLWNWAQFIDAPTAEMDAWRHRDIQDELADLTRMPVYLQNDATAACGAELVFGTGPRPRDFLYFYVAYFIGGGVALNGQLYTGRSGNAGALGSMPVPAPGGGLRQLISVASLASLESYLQAEGVAADRLWETPPGWSAPEPILARWIEEAATGIAHAILGATALLDIDTALIDGWMPAPVRARLVEATAARLAQADRTGIELPQIHPGSIGSRARQLGAASIPLSQRYLVDQNALLTLG